MPATPSPYLARRQRTAVGGLIGLLIAALVVGAIGWFVGVKPLVEALLTNYTETQAEAVSEGTVKVTVGSRRSRHTENRRAVDLEYTVAGQKWTDTVESATVQVGDSVTVWVDEAHPSVAHLERPTASTWNWIAAAVAVLVVGILVWAVVAAIQKLVAVASFTPERAKGRLLLTAFNIADAVVDPNQKLKAGNVNRAISTQVIQSDLTAHPTGTLLKLTARGNAVPAPHDFGQQVEALLVRQGFATTLVAARANGADQQWWIAELGKLEPTSNGQA